ncbi:MAG: hypothetical protein VR67_15725 [Peptococcaceae bacterium BRH_c8a]|nr:MAG: hypothetical protein VR67_15725 [Peptococcaceae bacterium BRH_c8a]
MDKRTFRNHRQKEKSPQTLVYQRFAGFFVNLFTLDKPHFVSNSTSPKKTCKVGLMPFGEHVQRPDLVKFFNIASFSGPYILDTNM